MSNVEKREACQVLTKHKTSLYAIKLDKITHMYRLHNSIYNSHPVRNSPSLTIESFDLNMILVFGLYF